MRRGFVDYSMSDLLQLPLFAPAPVRAHAAKIWLPKRVVFTPAALDEEFGQQILARVEAHGLEVELLKSNRITNLRGTDTAETYGRAKSTLAVVKAPPSALRLQPTPPSADWQMNLAEGCPAHCQYCYLAGSLTGPPVIRVFANLPQLLQNTATYEQAGRLTSFEVSCYTDVLGIEHLTGSLTECIRTMAPAKEPACGSYRSTIRLIHCWHCRTKTIPAPALA